MQSDTGDAVADMPVGVSSLGLSATTDSAGNYDFGEVDPGTYTVEAQKDGYDPPSTSQTLDAPAATQTVFQLIMKPAKARIGVNVVNDKGTPVKDVTVSVDGQGWSGVTGADGSFDFGEVPPGSYTMSGTKDGYTPSPATDSKDAPANANTQYKLVLTCDPKVTIEHVLRGGNLPDSVAPTKTYSVKITVVPDEGCPDHTIELSVANSGTGAGAATVSPTSITGSTTITVTGVTQTAPGSGGQLKIQAKLDGTNLKAESPGFSVCAHPINYTDTFVGDIDAGRKVGVRVQDGWESDSGSLADLNEAEDKEVVQYDPPTSPPYASGGTAQNSDYLPANNLTQDSHTIGRPAAGPAASWERRQLCIFKCHRCGAVDQPHANSGFKIVHEVFQDGSQWKHRVTKSGAAVSIGAYSVGAGSASVTSLDHLLP